MKHAWNSAYSRLPTSLSLSSSSCRVKSGLWEVFTKETESQEVRSHTLRPLRQLLKVRSPSLAADAWEVKPTAGWQYRRTLTGHRSVEFCTKRVEQNEVNLVRRKGIVVTALLSPTSRPSVGTLVAGVVDGRCLRKFKKTNGRSAWKSRRPCSVFFHFIALCRPMLYRSG